MHVTVQIPWIGKLRAQLLALRSPSSQKPRRGGTKARPQKLFRYAKNFIVKGGRKNKNKVKNTLKKRPWRLCLQTSTGGRTSPQTPAIVKNLKKKWGMTERLLMHWTDWQHFWGIETWLGRLTSVKRHTPFKLPGLSTGSKMGQMSGFTLIEVMIAGSLGIILSLVLFEMLIQAQHMADTMIMQSTLNSHAREVFDMLMDGGVKSGGASAIATDRIPGFHGRSAIDNLVLSRMNEATTTFRLRLGPANDPNDPNIFTSEILPTFNVSCSATETPIKECGTDWNNKTYTVDGFIDHFGFYLENPVSGGLLKTYNISLTLIDSYRVPRNANSQQFSQMEYSTSFWTALTLILD